MSLELRRRARPKFDSSIMSDTALLLPSYFFLQNLFQRYSQYSPLNSTQRLSISRSSGVRSYGRLMGHTPPMLKVNVCKFEC